MPRPVVDPDSPIATTVYRAEPRTREFVFRKPVSQVQPGVDLSSPGARARLEDQLAYQRQLIDAMTGAGASLENSPQFASMLGAHQAGMKSLADQAAVEAEMAKANASQMMAATEAEKLGPKGMHLAWLNADPMTRAANPIEAAIEGGLYGGDEPTLGAFGGVKGEDALATLRRFKGAGMPPLVADTEGQPMTRPGLARRAFLGIHGPAVQGHLATGNTYTDLMGGGIGPRDRELTALINEFGLGGTPPPAIVAPVIGGGIPPSPPVAPRQDTPLATGRPEPRGLAPAVVPTRNPGVPMGAAERTRAKVGIQPPGWLRPSKEYKKGLAERTRALIGR